MKNAGWSAIVLSLSLLFASCVQPVHKLSRDESFMKREATRKPWRRVAILPFTGDPAVRRVAAEWFAFRVHRHGLFEVVDPSLAEIELKKNGILFGDAGTTLAEAQNAGNLLGVDGVVFGSIAPQPPPVRQGPPTAGASIVDMATGKVVGNSIHSYVMGTRDLEERVMVAVDRVEEDLVPVFYAAAGRSWTPPPKEDTQGQDPPESR